MILGPLAHVQFVSVHQGKGTCVAITFTPWFATLHTYAFLRPTGCPLVLVRLLLLVVLCASSSFLLLLLPSKQSHNRNFLCVCAAADADFLGFGSQEATEEAFMPESPTGDSSPAQPSQPAYPPPPDATPPATPDNLADFFSTPAAGPPGSTPNPTAQSSTAHIDDMFSAAPKPPPRVSKPQAAASPAAAPSGAGGRGVPGGSAGAGAGVSQPTPKPAPKAAPASMIDFGNEAAMLAEHPDLYKGLEEVPGEFMPQKDTHNSNDVDISLQVCQPRLDTYKACPKLLLQKHQEYESEPAE